MKTIWRRSTPFPDETAPVKPVDLARPIIAEKPKRAPIQRRRHNLPPGLHPREQHRARKYGLQPGEFRAMYDAQDGRCAICARAFDPRRLCVDHCHSTDAVRGLLCRACNQGLGHFRDSPARLLAAAAYLERDRAKEDDRPE